MIIFDDVEPTEKIKIYDTNLPEFIGYGEASPLPGLSPDALPAFEKILDDYCQQLSQQLCQKHCQQQLQLNNLDTVIKKIISDK